MSYTKGNYWPYKYCFYVQARTSKEILDKVARMKAIADQREWEDEKK